MTEASQLEIFNHPQRFIEGWYWLLRSPELKRGKVKAVSLLGRDLAVYRTTEGKVVAMDAHCPHMGAHLAEGKVEKDSIRCFFHNWKFTADGRCEEIPCLSKKLPLQLTTWPVKEAYGLIWLWTGSEPTQPLPFAPELEVEIVDFSLSKRFIKDCHPNVVMVNAIDAHHFNTVHNFPVAIAFKAETINQNVITFNNTTRGGGESWLIRLIQPFYREAGTYNMCYWFGSTGTVTLGPDFLHFYIMFALRLLENGKTEGETILMTKRRAGLQGWLFNRLILWATKLVGNYFAKGDTQIFKTIKFNLKTPIRADQSIIEFMHHVEQQKALAWETWEEVKETHHNDVSNPVQPNIANITTRMMEKI
ncbi:MAG: aromatic ring-hydroxylating dioxygenase subunit alpha [Limnothrix sp. RL_2_0]|nr:aromatic ring-hydroxylating dioxygenase subunit alpha [Limnothrix sp. RL_2_0]